MRGPASPPAWRLRAGRADDLPVLDAIALAAKAHWGYSAAQLCAWRQELAVVPASLGWAPLRVAQAGPSVVGFAQVDTRAAPPALEALWVLPGWMGRGVGRALLAWASSVAAAGGAAELAIDADPNALGFYAACGARVVGSVPAPIEGEPGRVRPQLRLPTSPAGRRAALGCPAGRPPVR